MSHRSRGRGRGRINPTLRYTKGHEYSFNDREDQRINIDTSTSLIEGGRGSGRGSKYSDSGRGSKYSDSGRGSKYSDSGRSRRVDNRPAWMIERESNYIDESNSLPLEKSQNTLRKRTQVDNRPAWLTQKERDKKELVDSKNEIYENVVRRNEDDYQKEERRDNRPARINQRERQEQSSERHLNGGQSRNSHERKKEGRLDNRPAWLIQREKAEMKKFDRRVNATNEEAHEMSRGRGVAAMVGVTSDFEKDHLNHKRQKICVDEKKERNEVSLKYNIMNESQLSLKENDNNESSCFSSNETKKENFVDEKYELVQERDNSARRNLEFLGVGGKYSSVETNKNVRDSNNLDSDYIESNDLTLYDKEENELKNLVEGNEFSDEIDILNCWTHKKKDDERGDESERARKRRERKRKEAAKIREKQLMVKTEYTTTEASSSSTKDPVRAVVQSKATDVSGVLEDHGKSVEHKNDKSEEFDMFSEGPEFPKSDDTEIELKEKSSISITEKTDAANTAIHRDDDFDDFEGYYKATIGEIISFSNTDTHLNSFKVLGILGKGVFSSVLKCVSTINANNLIAIKLIRNNETMAKAARKEIRILRLLRSKDDSQYNHYIVRLFEIPTLDQYSNQEKSSKASSLLEFRNHTALPFEHLPYNLRQILNRFGSGLGINLEAVQSYARQLFSALRHLMRYHLVHADIKPENILVSGDYSMVKLADFGSAFFISDVEYQNSPTPYLVSRFYRPPEVILGLDYNHYSVDLWSVSVTLAELYTGNVLFPGHSNNDMIRLFMESMGAFSNKMVKRHVRAYEERLQTPPFFDIKDNYAFHQQTIDRVTQKPIVKVMKLIQPIQARKISTLMLKSCGTKDERPDVMKFSDLLGKCLSLDPTRRLGVDGACRHEFFVGRGKKIKANIVDFSEKKNEIGSKRTLDNMLK